jgi:hypothetical protein
MIAADRELLKPLEEVLKTISVEQKVEKGLSERLRSALAFLLGVLENYPPDRPSDPRLTISVSVVERL